MQWLRCLQLYLRSMCSDNQIIATVNENEIECTLCLSNDFYPLLGKATLKP
jgi:hypothetical protein